MEKYLFVTLKNEIDAESPLNLNTEKKSARLRYGSGYTPQKLLRQKILNFVDPLLCLLNINAVRLLRLLIPTNVLFNCRSFDLIKLVSWEQN